MAWPSSKAGFIRAADFELGLGAGPSYVAANGGQLNPRDEL
jgi:hypothetical protein